MDEYMMADAELSIYFVWMCLRSDRLVVRTTDVDTVHWYSGRRKAERTNLGGRRWRSGPGEGLYSSKPRAKAAWEAGRSTLRLRRAAICKSMQSPELNHLRNTQRRQGGAGC